MKILQLTKKFPYPLKDGESIAVTNQARAFNSLGCDLWLLSMNTIKHHVDIEHLPDSFNQYSEIYTVFLDNRVNVLGAITNLLSKDSYHVSRFFFKEFETKLISILKNNTFDIIQLETLYLAPYIDIIKSHSTAKIVMRSHNVEFEIWQRIVENTSFLPKKWYLSYLTKKLKKFEIAQLDKYDYLVTVTKRDLEQYQNLGYVSGGISSPIALDLNEYIIDSQPAASVSFFFIGSLDWIPNLEGLSWFLEHIWDKVINKHPNVKIHIAGRNTPESIQRLASDNIIIEGEVDDAIEFISSHTIMVVPLLSGSGMRVKILEGMALKRVVISTTIGAEGIGATNKMEILIANTIKEFLEVIDDVIFNSDETNSIGIAARKYISDNFDRKKNAKDLIAAYKKLV
ncbi:MAG: glycosyltransferase family 4 protein [Saprospiraceae bacterium]